MRNRRFIMQTLITERGQISIPAEVRKKMRLVTGMGMEWIVTARGIYLYPVPKDPIQSFRGSLREPGLLEKLLKERRQERKRDLKK